MREILIYRLPSWSRRKKGIPSRGNVWEVKPRKYEADCLVQLTAGILFEQWDEIGGKPAEDLIRCVLGAGADWWWQLK